MWVVEALRFGSRENHSYVVGVYNTRTLASEVARAEECWRGGKYICYVSEFIVDDFNQDKMDYMNEC
jgi:hypothetical protein